MLIEKIILNDRMTRNYLEQFWITLDIVDRDKKELVIKAFWDVLIIMTVMPCLDGISKRLRHTQVYF